MTERMRENSSGVSVCMRRREKQFRKTKPFSAPSLLKKGQYDELRVAESDSVAFY